jgi:hypothetical protein
MSVVQTKSMDLEKVKDDSLGWFQVASWWGGRLVIKCVRAVPALSWHGQRNRVDTSHHKSLSAPYLDQIMLIERRLFFLYVT